MLSIFVDNSVRRKLKKPFLEMFPITCNNSCDICIQITCTSSLFEQIAFPSSYSWLRAASGKLGRIIDVFFVWFWYTCCYYRLITMGSRVYVYYPLYICNHIKFWIIQWKHKHSMSYDWRSGKHWNTTTHTHTLTLSHKSMLYVLLAHLDTCIYNKYYCIVYSTYPCLVHFYYNGFGWMLLKVLFNLTFTL